MFEPDVEIIAAFPHLAGTTGLADADWTKKLFLDGASQSLNVIVTEISGGFYKAQFTPTSEGLWFLYVYETASAANFWQDYYHVWSLLTHLGGQDYDAGKHSLRKVRAAIDLIRNDQVVEGLRNGKKT